MRISGTADETVAMEVFEQNQDLVRYIRDCQR
jgi:hypothetical protein